MRLPLISAAMLGASLLALPVPALAAQFAGFSKIFLPVQVQSSDSPRVQEVRYRGRHYRRYDHYHDDAGAAVAGAIIGMAIGAMIASQAAQYNRSVEWCMRRYRSYDPRTHTWIDYKGRIRYCP